MRARIHSTAASTFPRQLPGKAPVSVVSGDRPLRTAPWLAQLELLASLPWSLEVLMPSVLYVLRQGIAADFGTFTPLDQRSQLPGAIYAERFMSPVMQWLCQPRDAEAVSPPLESSPSRALPQARMHDPSAFVSCTQAGLIESMVMSDGESRRAMCLHPEYEDSVLYQRVFRPFGLRWSACVPLLDERGRAHGLLFLHRSARAGAFSHDEMGLMRQARLALRGLTRARPPVVEKVPHRPTLQALVLVDARGDFVGMNEPAAELLYRSWLPAPGSLAWSRSNVDALPRTVRQQVLALAATQAPAPTATAASTAPVVPAAHGAVLHRAGGQGGGFEFSAERLVGARKGGPTVAVHVRALEPAEVALARALTHWALSPQEKRLLVQTLSAPDQYALADSMGLTLNTLKGYVRDMLRRTGFESRQAMVEGVLQGAEIACDA